MIGYANSLLLLLLGAGLTFLTQFLFERKKEREQNRRAAWSLLHSVQAMTEALIGLDQVRAESIVIAEAKGRAHLSLWQNWQEKIGFGDPAMKFSADELIVLSSMHDGAFTTKVREIESAHRIFLKAAETLSELRAALGQHCTFATGDTLASLNPPPSALPIIMKLDTLSESLESLLPDAVVDAKAVASKIGPRLKKHYKLKKFATLDYSGMEEAPAACSAAASR